MVERATKEVQEKGFCTIEGIKSIQAVDDDQKVNKENISQDKGNVSDDRLLPKRRLSLHRRRTAAVLSERNIQEIKLHYSPVPPKSKNTFDNNESVDMDLANDYEFVEEKNSELEVSATNMQSKSNCIMRRMVVSTSTEEQTNLEK